MSAILKLVSNNTPVHATDEEDEVAGLIAGLSKREADVLWGALIQLKPSLARLL
jgi:hypothetical protein